VLALYLVLILDRLEESLSQMSIVFEYISIMEIDLHDHVPDASLDFRRHGIDEFEQYADGNQIHPGLFVFDLKNGFRIDSLFAVKAFEIAFIVFFDEMGKIDDESGSKFRNMGTTCSISSLCLYFFLSANAAFSKLFSIIASI
jgi:hypothetical protein